MPKVRRPTQAGAFYEATHESLQRQISSCFTSKLGPGKLPEVNMAGPRNVIGLVCPHAGYMYSGPVAAHAYGRLAEDGKPDIVIIFGPNHTGCGSGVAIMNEGVWRTPLADAEVDTETAERIVKESKIVDVDDTAHSHEHSIEVQIPFLQYLYGSAFRFVPICFLMQDISTARDIGQATAKAINRKNAVIIASSDMTHYEPQERAEEKDREVLRAVETMDEACFSQTVESRRVTACGTGPIMALMTAAKALGAKEAKLLCYKTSGDVIGDYSSVVGYAAVCFTK
jgi:AmmeMemoRadiSam system protein B